MNRRELIRAGVASAPLLWGFRATAAASREPIALATADTESHVAGVYLLSGRRAGRTRTLEGPRSIQRGPGGTAVVAHTDHGAITLLEGRPVRVRRVLRGFEQPRYTAVARDGRHAFVTDSGAGELVVVDLERGRVVRRVEVGALARHIDLDQAGGTLWIGLGSSASEIAVVDVRDPLRPRRRASVHPPFLAHDVGFAPGGQRVWVTAGRERRIAVFDARRRTPIALLSADDAPQHVTFGSGRAFVASGDGGSVRVHSLNGERLLRSTSVAVGSYNVQRAFGHVLTPSLGDGTLTILDGAGRIRHAVRVAAHAHDACALP